MVPVMQEINPVLLKLLLWLGVAVSSLIQGVLLSSLVTEIFWIGSPTIWLLVHVLLSALGAGCAARLLSDVAREKKQQGRFYVLLFALAFLIPFAGTAATFVSIYYGFREGLLRHREPDYWQLTPRVALPFTTPKGRVATKLDSRGFSEHLLYSKDDDDLYRKVLAVANIRTALSVSTLKQAMRHRDERVRLTAYKTLDKKVSDLNREIQSLEEFVNTGDTTESSNTWLQIASNYWELLTIERGEPVARKQLLKKASEAAIQAVAVLPINRNAHFILGRVSLMQGDTRRAKIALERSMALGMPGDKVLPQLAEAAFMLHDYPKVKELLSRLDPATRAYPPLSHVAEYWT
jgi:hypothetical protein